MNNSRDNVFDVMKGIGILLVVIGHIDVPIAAFIYSFHMALFFMISGLFINSKVSSISNLIKFIYKRFIRLYIPFVLMQIIFILLHNFFVNNNILTSDTRFLEGVHGNSFGLSYLYSSFDIIKSIKSALLFMPQEILIGPSWFLPVLFYSSVIYSIIKLVLSYVTIDYQNILLCLIVLILSTIGFKYTGSVKSIHISCSIIPLYMISGWFLKFYQSNKFENKSKIFWLILSLISTLLILCFNKYPGYVMDLSSNNIKSTSLFVLLSLLGFILTFSVSKFILEFRWFSQLFKLLGQNTMCIFFLHLLSFKIVTYIYILIFSEQSYRLASFPVYRSDGLWWFLYLIAGIFIPIIINKIKDFLYLALLSLNIKHKSKIENI